MNNKCLINLRELNGLTRKELANQLNISEETVWHYEKNVIEPNIGILRNLTNIFSVKSNYFFKKDDIPNVAQINNLSYKKFNENIEEIKFELQYLNFLHYYLNYFKSFVNLPYRNLLSLEKRIAKIYNKKMLFKNKTEDFEKIAFEARRYLKLNANKKLMYTLEQNGIYIVEKDLNKTLDAYSIWIDDYPYIVLNKNCQSESKRIFSIAKQLGHLLLHKDIDFLFLTQKEYKNIEQEADIFASCFLLPKETIVNDFKTIIKQKNNPKSYIPLKEKYYISISNIEHRCYKLNLLTKEEHSCFYKKLNDYGYLKLEPFDKEWLITVPSKIYFMIKHILDNHLISVEEILNKHDIKQSFLNDIFNFRNDIF